MAKFLPISDFSTKVEYLHLQNLLENVVYSSFNLKPRHKNFIIFVENLDSEFISRVHFLLIQCCNFNIKLNIILKLITYIDAKKDISFIDSKILNNLKPLFIEVLNTFKNNEFLKKNKIKLNNFKLFITFRYKSGFSKIRNAKCNFVLLSLLNLINKKRNSTLFCIIMGDGILKGTNHNVDIPSIKNGKDATIVESNKVKAKAKPSIEKKTIISTKNTSKDKHNLTNVNKNITDYYFFHIEPLCKDTNNNTYSRDHGLSTFLEVSIRQYSLPIFKLTTDIDALISGKTFSHKCKYEYRFVDETDNSYISIVLQLREIYSCFLLLYNIRDYFSDYNKIYNFLSDRSSKKNETLQNILNILDEWDKNKSTMKEFFTGDYGRYLKTLIELLGKDIKKLNIKKLNKKRFFNHLLFIDISDYYSIIKNKILNEIALCNNNILHISNFVSSPNSKCNFSVLIDSIIHLKDYYKHNIVILNSMLILLNFHNDYFINKSNI